MLEQETVDRFIEDTLNEIRRIDLLAAKLKAEAAALAPQLPESPEARKQAQALLQEARAQAEAAGRSRRRSISQAASSESSRTSARRRNLV